MVSRLLALIVLAALSTSCGAFGSADGAANVDAGAIDGSDGGTVAAGDAGVDAPAPPVDGSATFSCGWQPFDDPFERTVLPGPGWTLDPNPNQAISLKLSGAPVVHGTSLEVDVQPFGETRSWPLKHALTPASGAIPTCIDVAFAIYVEKYASANNANVASIQLEGSKGVSVWLENTNQIKIAEQTTNGVDFLDVGFAPLPLGQWHTIHFRYTFGATTTIELDVDEVPVAITPSDIAVGKPTAFWLGAGFTYADATNHYWIDDVAVR